jgi:hypothetical protein
LKFCFGHIWSYFVSKMLNHYNENHDY